MGFHEIQFPNKIAYGSVGGPGFKTDVIITDSGMEERVSRWNQGRRRYNVSYGIKSYLDLSELIRFYLARRGVANGFRFRDHLDATTSDSGLASELGGEAVTHVDQKLGTGDGVTVDFQLQKRYQSGNQIRKRNITKPVDGTVLVGVNLVSQPSAFTVNITTGVVTFDTGFIPPLGTALTCGCQFDVPVRFGEELDDRLPSNIEDFGSGSIPDIPLVEIIDGVTEMEDEFYFGGSSEKTFALDVTITQLEGRVIVLKPSAPSDVVLPSTVNLPGGGPYFYLVNAGTAIVTIKDNSGSVIVSMQPGSMRVLVLAKISPDTWYAI